jgi:hypothetical protein
MWRFVALGALGLILGSKARSERGVVFVSLLFGLLYGGVEVMSATIGSGTPSLGHAIFLLGLGLVMAAPVYAIAEIWRRTRVRATGWLRRIVRR